MALLSPTRDRVIPSPSAGIWPGLFTPPTAPLHAAAAKALVRHAVKNLPLSLQFPDGSSWGAGGPALQVLQPQNLFARLGRDGLIGLGEAWMTGDVTAGGWLPSHPAGRKSQPDDATLINRATDTLAAVLTILAAHTRSLMPAALQKLRALWERHTPSEEENTQTQAQENIHRHYDLSNRLFELFLDPTMSYSSALYSEPIPSPSADDPAATNTLEQAQLAKIDSVLDLAGVKSGSSVLEIGSGWGALAIRAAQRGATVTTLTLSVEQQDLARQRISQAGLSDAIDVRLEDYRAHAAGHHGDYDAVVSVEMIEAVGEKYWPDYFAALDRVLRPGGRVGLQAITIGHNDFLATRGAYTWVHKYIFPGGILPSLQAIDEVLRGTRLRVARSVRLGLSYVPTLAAWRHTFNRNLPEIHQAGFDDTFARMWNFYLAYSQAGFAAEYIDDWQLQLSRP
ncbi:SAM-dependent methyltransferase [Nakamurella aerolata]|uniref:Class I SAM-dependent methyltransferase n=1 Tax=Nakamurella aerolata TaxID=1656892 RepID=A0A849A921_9ACTN|nr:cyclopropane-fatty-acyl-phospholipid synthase family protein [Nakamurella aerolata]NNG37049.1 class I SAM-dependent methyltransferase [Nakamurella aerolata]